MKPRGKIFLSYRREGGSEMARLVREGLRERGYEVFMDVEDLRSGPFNTELLRQIESSTDVVIILTPNSLDRCLNEGDWLCIEISHAIKCKKNVIPLMTRGFNWKTTSLPDELKELPNYQGIEPSHEYFTASMNKLASLLIGTPKKRENIKLYLAFLIFVFVVAAIFSKTDIVSTFSNISGFHESSQELQSAVEIAIQAVEVEEEKTFFTDDDDRDSQYFRARYIGSPERIYYEDLNSQKVWEDYLSFHSGKEIDPLLDILAQPITIDKDKCKILYLLKQSMININNITDTKRIIGAIAGYVGDGPTVQIVALSLIEETPYLTKQKWAIIKPYLAKISNECFGSLLRLKWNWIPMEEKDNICSMAMEVFSRTEHEWAASDISYSLRKLNCEVILPAIRKELTNTSSPWHARYLARLVEDFEDDEAIDALRTAFSKHHNHYIFGILSDDIPKILYKLEGESSISYIVKISLKGSLDLQSSIADEYFIGKEKYLNELDVIVNTGTEDEKRLAKEVIANLTN